MNRTVWLTMHIAPYHDNAVKYRYWVVRFQLMKSHVTANSCVALNYSLFIRRTRSLFMRRTHLSFMYHTHAPRSFIVHASRSSIVHALHSFPVHVSAVHKQLGNLLDFLFSLTQMNEINGVCITREF